MKKLAAKRIRSSVDVFFFIIYKFYTRCKKKLVERCRGDLRYVDFDAVNFSTFVIRRHRSYWMIGSSRKTFFKNVIFLVLKFIFDLTEAGVRIYGLGILFYAGDLRHSKYRSDSHIF